MKSSLTKVKIALKLASMFCTMIAITNPNGTSPYNPFLRSPAGETGSAAATPTGPALAWTEENFPNATAYLDALENVKWSEAIKIPGTTKAPARVEFQANVAGRKHIISVKNAAPGGSRNPDFLLQLKVFESSTDDSRLLGGFEVSLNQDSGLVDGHMAYYPEWPEGSENFDFGQGEDEVSWAPERAGKPISYIPDLVESGSISLSNSDTQRGRQDFAKALVANVPGLKEAIQKMITDYSDFQVTRLRAR